MQTDHVPRPPYMGAFPVNTGMCPARDTENTGDGARGVHLPLFLLSGLRQGLLDLLRYPVTPRVLGELVGQGHVVLHD